MAFAAKIPSDLSSLKNDEDIMGIFNTDERQRLAVQILKGVTFNAKFGQFIEPELVKGLQCEVAPILDAEDLMSIHFHCLPMTNDEGKVIIYTGVPQEEAERFLLLVWAYNDGRVRKGEDKDEFEVEDETVEEEERVLPTKEHKQIATTWLTWMAFIWLKVLRDPVITSMSQMNYKVLQFIVALMRKKKDAARGLLKNIMTTIFRRWNAGADAIHEAAKKADKGKHEGPWIDDDSRDNKYFRCVKPVMPRMDLESLFTVIEVGLVEQLQYELGIQSLTTMTKAKPINVNDLRSKLATDGHQDGDDGDGASMNTDNNAVDEEMDAIMKTSGQNERRRRKEKVTESKDDANTNSNNRSSTKNHAPSVRNNTMRRRRRTTKKDPLSSLKGSSNSRRRSLRISGMKILPHWYRC